MQDLRSTNINKFVLTFIRWLSVLPLVVFFTLSSSPGWSVEPQTSAIGYEIQKQLIVTNSVGEREATISSIGADFIKLHVSLLSLTDSDAVSITSADGGDSVLLTAAQNSTEGFWIDSLGGDSVLIRISGLGSKSMVVFDRIYRGSNTLTPEISQLSGLVAESICGIDDKEEVSCFENTHYEAFSKSNSVAKLQVPCVNNPAALCSCTAWRVGPNTNTMITNNHCLNSPTQLNATEVSFNFQHSYCLGNDAGENLITVRPKNILVTDFSHDITLFTIEQPENLMDFEPLLLDRRVPIVGEPVYIPQHAGGRDKELAIFSDLNSGNCAVDIAEVGGFLPGIDLGYFCDTEGGSSGAPVLSRVTNKVIGLHHFGSGAANCSNNINQGVRTDKFYHLIEDHLTGDELFECNGLTVTVNLSIGERPTEFDDVILGTPQSDSIYALGGNDTICAGGGDDFVDGGAGHDWISGGMGADDLDGGHGRDIVFGDDDNDLVSGGDDADKLYGGSGNDTLLGQGSADKMFGGSGDDNLQGSAGADLIWGQGGIDLISGGEGSDFLDGGGGNDKIKGGSGADNIYGADGNDEILGQDGSDILYGGTGKDLINGGDDDDLIYGGKDQDVILGAAGNDELHGGNQSDQIYGGKGEDKIFGENGNDRLWGQNSRDELHGGNGDDQIYGGDNTDTIFGGAGNDTIYGENSSDIIYGDSGDDRLFGGVGDDQIVGGAGNDYLWGQRGSNQLVGNKGNDTLDAGKGADNVLIGGNGIDHCVLRQANGTVESCESIQ